MKLRLINISLFEACLRLLPVPEELVDDGVVLTGHHLGCLIHRLLEIAGHVFHNLGLKIRNLFVAAFFNLTHLGLPLRGKMLFRHLLADL